MSLNFINRYLDKMLCRTETYIQTFEALDALYKQSGFVTIVEIGCVRQWEDWGAGYSTVLFGEFLHENDGILYTIDIDGNNIDLCKSITKPYADKIVYITEDSLSALPNLKVSIDLLYLDSLDVPMDGDRFICQRHNLNELLLAEPKLHQDSIILIDDVFDGTGKPKLSKDYLLKSGWNLVLEKQQVLFMR